MAYHELKIAIPPAFKNNFMDLLMQKGCLGFQDDEASLIAYFPESFKIQELLLEMEMLNTVLEKAGLKDRLKFSCSTFPDQDWNQSWKKGFIPIAVGERFTVLPPWEKMQDSRINLVIDPGMAFGTGHHETTRSCLILMEKYESTIAKDSFLDLGTGTGLLAIAASKLGFQRIVAVDTDPLAIDATRQNAALNQVTNIEIHEGSISEAPGTFDCIAANIISGVLIMLAPAFAFQLKPSGIVILSGILQEQSDDVAEAMQQAGLIMKEEYPDNKWVSMVFHK